jgi:hypothetical protein
MPMIRTMTICAAVLSFTIATSGIVLAQFPPTSTPAPSATDKQAISKACSDQANAKGLHGKPRKKFRSECKRRGGKPL